MNSVKLTKLIFDKLELDQFIKLFEFSDNPTEILLYTKTQAFTIMVSEK